MFLPMHFARDAANRLLMLLAAIALLASPGFARADPPGRVARIGYVSGPASFAPAGEDVWIAATLNRPLVTGDQLWSDGGARVELQMGLAAVRLGSNTSVTLLNLDDRVAQFQLTQGTVRLRVRRINADEVIEIDTPNLAYVIRKPGQYRITVDPVEGSTMVWTGNGQAQAFADGASYLVGAGRAYRFYGNDLGDYEQLAMPGSDEFDRWSQLRDRRDDNSMSSNYVALDVIGYQDLDTYGSWRNVPEYGYVWTPSRVRAGWAPYRDGHWSWIEPWGWTWVDDAPWGFTVSHYGRWASINGRWAWIPGPVATQAVYAPALVAFIGGGDFDRLGSSNRASVSWFPLSPRDVYRPAYNVSQKYFTRVNASNTAINASSISIAYDERSQLHSRPGRNGAGSGGNRGNRGNQGDGGYRGDRNEAYANQHVPGAVISVPTAAFIQARPVARSAINLPPATLANAPVVDMAAVAPVFTSLQGAAPQGRRPPAATQAQRVVARSAPPPPPAAFSSREKLLAADPGKPIEAPALAAIKPTRSAPVPKVDVLEPARIMNPVAAPPPLPEGSRPRANRDAAPAARQETMRPDALPAAPPPPTPMSAPRNPAGNPAASREAPMSPRAPVAMQPAPRPPATAPEIAPAPVAAPAAAAPGTGRPARPAPADRDNRSDRREAAPSQSPPDRQPVAAEPRAPMAMPPAAAPPRAPAPAPVPRVEPPAAVPAPAAPARAPLEVPRPRVEPPAAVPAPAAPARAPLEVPRPRIDPPAGARPALPPPPPAAPPPAPTSQDKRGSDAPPQAAPKADNKGGRNDARKDAKKDKDDKKESETDKEREEKKPK